MDNITHTLIGAVLGQAGLKRRTGLAMPALMIAANLPDVDAPCVLLGIESLAMRRGLSHGPVALVLLPLVLAGLLIAFDRWQARQGTRPRGRADVRPGWLLALCFVGMLTHLAFDWLNNYGIRLLEPFSSRWFYGDALFIVDPWMLAMLAAGVWLSRRRERSGSAAWQRPARVAIGGVLAFVALNIGISRGVVTLVRGDAPYPEMAVANAVPGAFWRRDVLWRADGTWGTISCSWLACRRHPIDARPTGMDDPRIAGRVAGNPAAEAFLFWSRMPIAEIEGNRIVLKDQRFLQATARGGFAVELKPR